MSSETFAISVLEMLIFPLLSFKGSTSWCSATQLLRETIGSLYQLFGVALGVTLCRCALTHLTVSSPLIPICSKGIVDKWTVHICLVANNKLKSGRNKTDFLT